MLPWKFVVDFEDARFSCHRADPVGRNSSHCAHTLSPNLPIIGMKEGPKTSGALVEFANMPRGSVQSHNDWCKE
jgi:hypothetical protein